MPHFSRRDPIENGFNGDRISMEIKYLSRVMSTAHNKVTKKK